MKEIADNKESKIPVIKAIVPPETPGTISAVPIQIPFKNKYQYSKIDFGPGEAMKAYFQDFEFEALSFLVFFKFTARFLGMHRDIFSSQTNNSFLLSTIKK